MDEVLGGHSMGTADMLQVEQGPGFQSLIVCPLTFPLPQLPGAELLYFVLMATGFRAEPVLGVCI